MRNPLAGIELCEAGLDPREEHQPFDRIIECGVIREILESIKNALAGRGSWHAAILAPAALIGPKLLDLLVGPTCSAAADSLLKVFEKGVVDVERSPWFQPEFERLEHVHQLLTINQLNGWRTVSDGFAAGPRS